MTSEKEALPGCQAVNIRDLQPDEKLEHHLITLAFSPAHEIHIFESSKLQVLFENIKCIQCFLFKGSFHR